MPDDKPEQPVPARRVITAPPRPTRYHRHDRDDGSPKHDDKDPRAA